MSYLLDAIRKAEKQRSEDSVPTLEGLVKERRARSGKRRGRGLVLLALAGIIAAGLYFNQTQVSSWWQTARSGVAGLADGVSLFRDETPSNQAEVDQPAPTSSTQEAADSTGSKISDTQRALISQIEFTVLSYSVDDNKRFVMVGSSVLREGDLLEGFEILRIQSDGVVIDVGGKAVLVRP